MSITFNASPARLVSERFDIKSKLGSGGFGVVYRAFDREQGTDVAIKTLHDTNPRTLFRFKREFRALADIAHPNLVKLYELISEDSVWYFTMELVDGVDFLRWIDRGHDLRRPALTAQAPQSAEPHVGAAATVDIDANLASDTSEMATPSPMQTGEILAESLTERSCPADDDRLRAALGQLTRGLITLHRFGKLHRDIKPSNVLVDRDGRVVLLDFGMVTEFGSTRSPLEKLERDSNPAKVRFAGTPRYMSPEQAMGEDLDEATDWYAVGVVL